MLGDLGGIGGVELVGAHGEPGADRVDVGASVVGGAHGVEQQFDLRETDRRVEVPQDGDDLDIEIGIGRPERLETELVVLTEPSGLRTLVAEAGSGVPDLPWRRGAMLHERSRDRRRALGSKGEVPLPLVEEVVHLLADHIGALADS